MVIAGGCPSYTWSNPDSGCAWLDMRGMSLFIQGMDPCTKPVDPDGDVGGFCYNNPANGYSIFGS
ncbi:hypothetical protein [Intestinibacter bartlettii]|uniref:hypothetical protein n=1 Tax=Intestinibacter bartlettii TaxID=261299 RepID=UPI0035213292